MGLGKMGRHAAQEQETVLQALVHHVQEVAHSLFGDLCLQSSRLRVCLWQGYECGAPNF